MAKIAAYAALGFPPNQVKVASAVALAESGGDARIDNGICCVGLWQVNRVHAGILGSPKDPAKFTEWLKNPVNNARAAGYIFRTQEPKNQWSMNKWEAWGNGSYTKFLGSALSAEVKNGGGANLAAATGVTGLAEGLLGGLGDAGNAGLDAFKGFTGLDDVDTIPGVSVPGGADGESLGGAVTSIANSFKWIAKVIRRLSDPATYLRLGKGVLGGLLIAMGVAFLLYTAAKAFMDVAPVKAVAKKAATIKAKKA